MIERPDIPAAAQRSAPEAHDALGKLLDSLHQRGFLRVAHDFVDANSQVAEMLGGLSQPEVQAGMQNLAVLLTALSRIPADQLGRFAFAATDAVNHVANWQPTEHRDAAPGVTGAYRLLHDEALWQAVTPLLEGLKVFLQRLHEAPGAANPGAAGARG
ncbi:hypothetical protein [Burkholderia perseverans]|uniref:hypothetical protein n=1 Tax=Burkholderia perseverans TaxID=2615214 RepID=UPI001FEDD9FE|nr:hypothetical protein [Burkholderia perseverans]